VACKAGWLRLAMVGVGYRGLDLLAFSFALYGLAVGKADGLFYTTFFQVTNKLGQLTTPPYMVFLKPTNFRFELG
jgi:hypothetical protein